MIPFKEPSVKERFLDFDKPIREKLLLIRALIFEVASRHKEIRKLTETLRWGQPSYIPEETNSGTLIRLDTYPAKKDHFAIYFHCQTYLILNFKEMFPQLKYDVKRAIFFRVDERLPKDVLKMCFYEALTYKINPSHKG